MCSRECEDYLDWLENQGRPSLDFFKPLRLLAGFAGAGVVAWVTSLILC
jgi:hypothetical protein